MNVRQVVQQAEQLMEQYLDDLKTTVNIDSGTYTKHGIDRVGAYLQERFQSFGFSTRIDRQEQYGNHLVATHTGNAPQGPRILLIGHIDTVFPAGEVERRPFAISQQNGRHIATGTVVSSRRASGQYRVEVRGVSAHAGVEPQRGRNAILELSYQVQKMQALNGTVPGTTLSVAVIHGGERTNVVPDYAYFDMDV